MIMIWLISLHNISAFLLQDSHWYTAIQIVRKSLASLSRIITWQAEIEQVLQCHIFIILFSTFMGKIDRLFYISIVFRKMPLPATFRIINF